MAIGILGGTFDPVHCGHLRLALEILEHLELSSVRLIPVGTPPHRVQPRASADLRRAMLEAATSGVDELCVDDRELRRSGPSYTVDTLASLRADFHSEALCLLVGMDAFAGFASWHRWRDILPLAHIVVARRPGAAIPADGPVAELLALYRTDKPQRVRRSPAGHIYVQEIPALEISSSHIRRLIAEGNSPRYLLPDAVHDIIMEERIYGAE